MSRSIPIQYEVVTGKFNMYNTSFNSLALEALGDLLSHVNVIPLTLLATFGASAGSIGMQHDLDISIGHGVKFAKWEAEHNIGATYFVLNSAAYWFDKPGLYRHMHEIVDLGHEVGLHHHVGSNVRELHKAIDELRQEGFDIEGVAEHGIGKRPFPTHEIWKYTSLEEQGLLYEAYDMTPWIMDNNGEWVGMDLKPIGGLTLDKLTPGMHLSIHPCHWVLP